MWTWVDLVDSVDVVDVGVHQVHDVHKVHHVHKEARLWRTAPLAHAVTFSQILVLASSVLYGLIARTVYSMRRPTAAGSAPLES